VEPRAKPYTWTVADFLNRQRARCSICGFLILVDDQVDRDDQTREVTHVRCADGTR
jgi:hypothetical protein